MNNIERKKLKFPKDYNPENLSWEFVLKHEGVYKAIKPRPLSFFQKICCFYTVEHPVRKGSYDTFCEDVFVFEMSFWGWPEYCIFKEYRFGYLRLKWWVFKQIRNLYIKKWLYRGCV